MALISRFLASRTLRWGFAALTLAFGGWYVAEKWGGIHSGLHRSGTLARPVRDATAAGHPVLIEVDLAGARASSS